MTSVALVQTQPPPCLDVVSIRRSGRRRESSKWQTRKVEICYRNEHPGLPAISNYQPPAWGMPCQEAEICDGLSQLRFIIVQYLPLVCYCTHTNRRLAPPQTPRIYPLCRVLEVVTSCEEESYTVRLSRAVWRREWKLEDLKQTEGKVFHQD